MDLLQEIKRKSSSLEGHNSLDGVKAVTRHIEVAERYLTRAREGREEDLFNDVIYRTNQAFEGMLKEAYTVLTSKDGNKLSPHQIEQHLIQEKILTPRVFELFKNYRQTWRNPSTHDHTLFFGEQEALLAIVSVSAFTNILLDQIIEAINFQREQEEVQHRKEQIEQAIQNYEGKPFQEQLIHLLELFSAELINSFPDLKQATEVEIIGRLNGFLKSVPNITVTRGPFIAPLSGRRLNPDFFLKRNDEVVIIEVKRPGYNKRVLESGSYQLISYLEAIRLQHGILYIPPMANEQMETKTLNLEKGGRNMSIHHVVPKHLLRPETAA